MGKNTEDMYERVKNYIAKNRMILEGDVVAAGISGGADSICMLIMLWKLSEELDFRLMAVYVHHGVRKEADDDAAYVEQLCGRLGIAFFLKKVDMNGYAQKMGLSPEEAGRHLRYRAFGEALENIRESALPERQNKCFYKIAVAHNQNDKAETMLFHLFRGSGLKGLGSIRPVRGQVIRPLLCLDRTQIEAYLTQGGISFCTDSTNEEDTYTRNKIRHNILPYASSQINKNALAHINAAADILAATDAFIERQTVLAYKRVAKTPAGPDGQKEREIHETEGTVVLDLTAFRQEDVYLHKTILLYCLEMITAHRKNITGEHINALLNIISKEGSKEFSLPYGLCARKEYETLTICRRKNQDKEARSAVRQEPKQIPVSVPGEAAVPGLGVIEFRVIERPSGQDAPSIDAFCEKGQFNSEKTYTKWFDYDKITTDLFMRTRTKGDYLTIDSALRKQSVKDYMINEKIPRLQREETYMLAEGPHILWIPGYRTSQYYKVEKNTKRILQIQLRGGK